MNGYVKYPIGIQNFEKIRKGGYVYVDKTALVRRLIDAGELYYFLSRPHRFGKSLLLSTLAAYFEGKKELFEGLAIAETTREWPEEHPVLYLDLGGMTYRKPDDLTEQLDWHLRRWETRYGIAVPDRKVELRFASVILKAYEEKRRQVVILIDEYDKPLLEAINDEPLREGYRATLRGFYSNLKSRDGYIKFAMLTGVTKFSKTSIFSDLNNLNDISMNRKFATICGITEIELEHYLASPLKNWLRKTMYLQMTSKYFSRGSI